MVSKRKKPSQSYAKRLETFRRNHGGLTPYQWQKRRLATVGLTPWELRKARQERRLGPARREVAERLERGTAVQSLAAMRAANRAWSRSLPMDVADIPDSEEFNPHSGPNDVGSRRGLAVLVNQYNEQQGDINPAYVLAFYNAIVNPASNYWSNHEIQDDGTILPVMIGGRSNRVRAASAFHDYLIDYSELIADVDSDIMEEWFDARYSMALQ